MAIVNSDNRFLLANERMDSGAGVAALLGFEHLLFFSRSN